LALEQFTAPMTNHLSEQYGYGISDSNAPGLSSRTRCEDSLRRSQPNKNALDCPEQLVLNDVDILEG
jgi:hypothetical protein